MAAKTITLHPKQALVWNAKTRLILFLGGTQAGKSLKNSEPVLTPSGYVPIGNLHIGDNVYDRNGKLTYVTGVFPQGKLHCWEFITSDGKSIISSDEHLWVIHNPKHNTEKVMMTVDVVKKHNGSQQIPSCGQVDFNWELHYLSPYIIGALIGDGGLTHSVIVSSADKDILDRVSAELPDGYKLKHRSKYDYSITGGHKNLSGWGYSHVMDEIRALGLNVKSDKKFIPKQYLFDSLDNRKAMLQGLLDTDGTITKNKSIEYYTVSKQLAEDVVFLVETLGGKAKISIKTNCGYKKDGVFHKCKDCYRVRINITFNPFYLKRKADKFFVCHNTTNKIIKEVKDAGYHDCTCISVFSSTATYIAKDQIVTHNTMVGALWIQREIQKDMKADYLILAPTYKILSQATLRKWNEYRYLPGKWNEQKKEWQLPQGGRVFFRSADKPDSLESMTLKAAWLDEGCAMKQRVFPIVYLSRLGFHQGPLLITSTPYTYNWAYWDMYIPIKNGKMKDATLVECSTFDNPHYPKQDQEQLRIACGSETEYRKRFLGQFAKAEGLVYPDFSRNVHLETHEPFDVSYDRFSGLDFGYTEAHPTAYVGCVRDKDGTIWIEKTWKMTNKLLSDYAAGIKDSVATDNQRVFGDAAASQEIAEIAAYGVNIVPGNRQVKNQHGRDLIGRLLRAGKLKIVDIPENRAIVDEFETYEWDESKAATKGGKDEVIKDKDDLLDALRYAIVSVDMPIVVQTPRSRQVTIKPEVKYHPVTGSVIGYEQNGQAQFRQRWHIDCSVKTPVVSTK